MSQPTKQELIDHVESLVAKCAELTRERDEARRMYCSNMADVVNPYRSPEDLAADRGWDCYKEKQ
jgi:hypothetical protein